MNIRLMVLNNRTSMIQGSIGHLMCAAFALLAVMPILMLVQMVVLSRTYAIDLLRDRTQMSLLILFLIGCYSVGLVMLLAIVRQIRRARELSQKIKHESLSAIESVFGEQPGIEPESPDQTSRSDLETLTETLTRFQQDISKLIERVKPQASVFRQFRHLLEHIDEIIIMADEDGCISFSNSAAQRVLGILPERPVDQALSESCVNGPGRELLAGLLRGKQDDCDRLGITTASGERLLFEAVCKRLKSDANRDIKLLMLRDISDIKRMERQLYRTEKLASLGQLISGVAHELNNPLAAVLGFAELCRNSALSRRELDGNLEIIEREARRTARIVENLLNFSRRRSVTRAECDIHSLLERCFVLLDYQFKINSIKIARNYSADIPPLCIDEFQVQQVFMNILSNACQALAQTPVTAPTLRVKTQLLPGSGDIRIEVEDNGPGIPADVAEQVFDPFFTTKGEDQGTGLGLPISFRIMQEHGGAIGLGTPGPGFNTQFTVRFPSSCAAESKHKCSSSASVAAAQTVCSGRILVVEDEQSVLQVSTTALEQMGFTVDTASTLSEAKAALLSKDFDLALVDFYMADGQADELLAFVDSSLSEMSDRMIVASGDPGIAEKIKRLSPGETPIVLKPFHVQELQNTVRKTFQRVADSVH